MVHNIRLFASTTTEFESNGLGSLFEATKCQVTEEANGSFELEMDYPVWGKRYKDLIARNFIVCKSNPMSDPQIFRIYSISRPMDGIVTFNAQHISYDLTCHPLLPFTAHSCLEAMEGLKTHSLTKHNFEFSTDKSTVADFGFDKPVTLKSALGGTEGSILDTYGGDYEFNNFKVILHNKRGQDRGVTIRYGKNLTSFQQEENISKVYTSVYPYWIGNDDDNNQVRVELPEHLVNVDTEYNFTNVLIKDFSSDFQNEPTEEELRERCKKYIKDNDIGVPEIDFDVSFFQLSQSQEFADRALLDQIELFDTVTVEFEMLLGASAKAKVNKTVYDAIADRYDTISLGSVKSSIADTVVGLDKDISASEERTMSHMDAAVENATRWITNGKGYMVAVKDEAGNWKEICSLDEPSIEEAKNVWRWNNGGFGFSGSGYNGPYTLAITQDGHIVADFIDTGSLTADIIKAGILQDATGNVFYLDLINGILRMNATELTINAQSVNDYIDSSISDFTTSVLDPAIENLQKQVDGQIETWYYDYDPVLTKEPSNKWATDTEKAKHEGDLFFNRTTGHAYRFMKSGTSYIWQLIQDTDVTKALQNAANAQDTADNKRRVFVTTPEPPYDVGDLWVQGENGDILRCATAKAKGLAFSNNDWVKASKYTDDSSLSTFLNGDYKSTIEEVKKQVDGKIETWRLSVDPITIWGSTSAQHEGDIWFNTQNQRTYVRENDRWIETQSNIPDEMFSTFAGRAQVFVATPEPPYKVGDLWVQGENGDILRCRTGKTEEQSFSQSDWVKASKYTDDASLEAFITGDYADAVQSLVAQTDKKAETWYQGTDPVESENWNTQALKNEHKGDLWYDTGRQKTYIYNGTTWQETKSEPPTEVNELIKSKAQIFVSTPKPPYNVGDLWVQGSTGDILKCKTAKTSTQTFAQSDWDRASKYTDDSALTTFLQGDYKTDLANLKTQADQKAETWYQATDPANNWSSTAVKTEHKGDLWYDTGRQKTYIYNGTTWQETKSEPPTEVNELIKSKAQIFVSTPKPPYNVGDLWFQSSTSDIMTCKTARPSGNYYSGDWEKRNKYIDSATATSAATSAANDAIDDAMTQQNIFNKLTNGGTTQGIFIKNNKIYINAEYIDTEYLDAISSNLGTITAGVLKSTNYSAGSGYYSSAGFFLDLATGLLKTKYYGIDSSGGSHYKGTLDAANGTFSGTLSSVNGTFTGTLSAATGTFNGNISGASGTFTGDIENKNGSLVSKVTDGAVEVWWGSTRTLGLGYYSGNYTIHYPTDGSAGDIVAVIMGGSPMIKIPSAWSFSLICGNTMYMETQSGYYIHFYSHLKIGGNVRIEGNCYVVGSKPRIAKTDNYEERVLYCYETPSPLFGDIGEASTDEYGECCIFLDDIFTETTSTEIEYQVFLQKEGPGDIWIAEKTSRYFVVKGTENLKFAWEIKAKQKDYEYYRLEKYEEDPVETDYESQYYEEFETLTKEINDQDQQYYNEYESLLQEQEALYL